MKFSIIANPERYAIRDPFTETLIWCDQNSHHLFIPESLKKLIPVSVSPESYTLLRNEEDCASESDLVVAIGGDGTMLHTAQIIKNTNIPVLGINTGKLGFMANVQPNDVNSALSTIVEGKHKTEKRSFLKASTKNTEFHALNEFLFSRKGSTSLVTLTAYYDDQLLNRFWSDGLIISTPTGSTAYNLSAGGPIVMPGTPVMVITPINPHTLTTRPLVVPSNRELKIKVEDDSEHIIFSYDGKSVDENISEVSITQSDAFINLVQLPDQSYFKTLRDKLMWGADNREKK